MQIEVSTSITDNGTTSISINGIAKNHEMTALWVQDLKQKEEFTDANIEFSHTLSTVTTEFGLNLVYNKDIIFDLFEEVE